MKSIRIILAGAFLASAALTLWANATARPEVLKVGLVTMMLSLSTLLLLKISTTLKTGSFGLYGQTIARDARPAAYYLIIALWLLLALLCAAFAVFVYQTF